MVLIDNGFSLNVMLGNSADSTDLFIEVSQMKIYATGPALDCPTPPTGYSKECLCVDKYGMLLSYFSRAAKPPFPRSKVLLPIRKIKSDATWGGITNFHDMEFIGFNSNQTVTCGNLQAILGTNHYSADYIPQQKFSKVRFTDFDDNAIAYLMDPLLAWANLDDCGNWPCTAPRNVEIFFDTTYYSTTG